MSDIEQGYFSLIRWCPDITRGEFRNLGIILVDEGGEHGIVRHLERHELPPVLARGGLVSELLTGLAMRFRNEPLGVEYLRGLSETLYGAFQVTEACPTAVLAGDWESAAEALYGAYAKPREGDWK